MDIHTEQDPLLDRLLQEQPRRICDLGAGLGRHTAYLLQRNINVLAVDFSITDSLKQIARANNCALVAADITRLPFADASLESLWASHSLEHTTDPLSVLNEWRRVLQPDGILAVVVPPFKTEVVGRHVFTGWTVGQLMLTLLRAGFDIRSGSYCKHLYNICAIVRRAPHAPPLKGNDEILVQYHDHFPRQIQQQILSRKRTNPFGETISSFEGDIERLNW